MAKPDALNRKICELQKWQSVAWRRVADPFVTQYERREIRNHIKECDEELRHCLRMMSQRLRFQARPVTDAGRGNLAKLGFRILA
jgi:hypothetical protein